MIQPRRSPRLLTVLILTSSVATFNLFQPTGGRGSDVCDREPTRRPLDPDQ
jgi:hypothetical protein